MASINHLLLTRTPLKHRATRKRLVHARRQGFELVGSRRFSRPAHDGLDLKLEKYLPDNGVFVEAGANDGYTWSNTYYLERWRGWHGVLVEPIPLLSNECRRLRSRAKVYNCALVEPSYRGGSVVMMYSDLRSLVKGSEPELQQYVEDHEAEPYEVTVRAMTLNQILADAKLDRVDFVSLDLEGMEAAALRGFDLDTYRPQWMLIEVTGGGGRRAVESVLGDRYEAVDQPTGLDVLYRRLDD